MSSVSDARLWPQKGWWKKMPHSLKRISNKAFIGEVDGLRFLAIAPVVIQHLSERMQRSTLAVGQLLPDLSAELASRGFTGVYLFFAISGFILALPFLSAIHEGELTPSIKSYFLRRITRLEPPFILWMIVLFIVYLVVVDHSWAASFPHFLSGITYTHGLFFQQYNPINPVTWTLEIEIQFYLLAPLLFWLLKFNTNSFTRQVYLLFSILTFSVLSHYFQFYALPFKLNILGHLHIFLAGILAAELYLQGMHRKMPSLLGETLFIVCLLFILLGRKHDFYFWVTYPLALSTFIIAAFSSRYMSAFLRTPWISAIGGMCYTIYLIHLPLAEAYVKVMGNFTFDAGYYAHLIVHFILFAFLLLLISILAFQYIEKPFMVKNWPAILFRKSNVQGTQHTKEQPLSDSFEQISKYHLNNQ